jgi:hypothetical protein
VVLPAAGLGLGLPGLAHPAVLWIFSGILVAAGFVGGCPARIRLFPEGTGLPVKLLVAAVALAALPGALAPEVTYDAVAYHTGAPDLFLRIHKIVRLEGMFFTDMPLGLQMAYMFCVGIGKPAAIAAGSAKLLHFSLGLAAIFAAGRLGSRLGGGRAGTWAMVFAAATPHLAVQMMKANVDLGVMFLTVVGAYRLVGARGAAGAIGAGVCLGASAAMKLTGGYGVVAGALLFITRPRLLAFFLVGAVVPLGPWLAKSWILCGNPVYPFLYVILGGAGWSTENAAVYRADMTGPTSFNVQYGSLFARLAAPWLMVIQGRGGEGAFYPFVPVLIPGLILFRTVMVPAARHAAVFVAAYWVCWFVSARDPRFFLPAWPVACALAALVPPVLTGPFGASARLVCAVTAATVPFLDASLAYRTLNPGPVAWGAVTRRFYMERMIPPAGRYAPAARAANGNLSRADRLLVVGDVKGVLLEPYPVYPSLFDTPHLVVLLRESGSADRLGVKLRQRGISAIFYNPGGAVFLKGQFGHFRYSPAGRRTLRDFWERRLAPVWEMREGGGVVMGVYRVAARPDSRRPLLLPGEAE